MKSITVFNLWCQYFVNISMLVYMTYMRYRQTSANDYHMINTKRQIKYLLYSVHLNKILYMKM